MYTKDKNVRLFVRISNKDYYNLVQIAKCNNLTISDLVRNILRDFLSTQLPISYLFDKGDYLNANK